MILAWSMMRASQRFIRHMAPVDAFVSYHWQGDRMVMAHIEVDPSLRGTGLGARFAAEVFDAVVHRPRNPFDLLFLAAGRCYPARMAVEVWFRRMSYGFI